MPMWRGLFLLLFFPSLLWAQTRLSVQGGQRLYPIAVPSLCVSGPEGLTAAREVAAQMARNLELSGFFDVINPGAIVEAQGECRDPDAFAYSDWAMIGVEGLVRGVVSQEGAAVRIQLFLHDVQIQRVVLGKEYRSDITQVRSMAHRFSNEVVGFFTGEPGVFGSLIAYSARVGRFKELFLMEMDGSEVRQLTNERGLALGASWSPAGDALVYTSYRRRWPDLYLMSLANKAVQPLSQTEQLEMGGNFSNDGRYLLFSRSAGGGADIIVANRDGTVIANLTRTSNVIDISPDWSPDDRQVVFCSNRGGGPQIYVMDTQGANPRRVSFVSSNYCTSPVWSPKGDRIAMVCRADGGHQLFTVKPDGREPQQLTFRGRNEDPSWSPDGRYLVFSTTQFGGQSFDVALMRADGSNLRRLTQGRSDEGDPSWSPRR